MLQNSGPGSWPNLTTTYTYDGLNRLTNASVSGHSNYNESFTYDIDGNLLTKNRSGKNMTYVYTSGTDKLQRVDVNSATYSNFTFDLKGNLLTDSQKNITINSYDYRNLPLHLTKNSDSYYYNYDDKGNRFIKTTPQGRLFYVIDPLGRELGIYSLDNYELKTVNLYGHGLIGRVEIF